VDLYQSTILGRLPLTKGKEPDDEKYAGGTILYDIASKFIFVSHQANLTGASTVASKHRFERLADSFGIKVRTYLSDNHLSDHQNLLKIVSIFVRRNCFLVLAHTIKIGWKERARLSSIGLGPCFSVMYFIGPKNLVWSCGHTLWTTQSESGTTYQTPPPDFPPSKFSSKQPSLITRISNEFGCLVVRCMCCIRLFRMQRGSPSGSESLGAACFLGFHPNIVPMLLWCSTQRQEVYQRNTMLSLMKNFPLLFLMFLMILLPQS
jgi:hypothetical protein